MGLVGLMNGKRTPIFHLIPGSEPGSGSATGKGAGQESGAGAGAGAEAEARSKGVLSSGDPEVQGVGGIVDAIVSAAREGMAYTDVLGAFLRGVGKSGKDTRLGMSTSILPTTCCAFQAVEVIIDMLMSFVLGRCSPPDPHSGV